MKKETKPRPMHRPIKFLASALLALAFLIQNHVAERHFHAPNPTLNAGIHDPTGGAFLAKPFVPGTDQQEPDCPLCQVLGLAATTDVPVGIALLPPLDHDPIKIGFAIREARPLQAFQADHSPRGPPSFLSA